MGGAAAYTWLYGVCCVLVGAIFAMGWVLVAIGRRNERLKREERAGRKAQTGSPPD